jgi:MFS-type transporter involved in bile tolerance (Atg22 family)
MLSEAKHLWLFQLVPSQEALRFFALLRMTGKALLVLLPIACVFGKSFHRGDGRTRFMPVCALLVGMRRLQNARFIERVA